MKVHFGFCITNTMDLVFKFKVNGKPRERGGLKTTDNVPSADLKFLRVR